MQSTSKRTEDLRAMMAEIGRLGGLATQAKRSKRRRSQYASAAARARWGRLTVAERRKVALDRWETRRANQAEREAASSAA